MQSEGRGERLRKRRGRGRRRRFGGAALLAAVCVLLLVFVRLLVLEAGGKGDSGSIQGDGRMASGLGEADEHGELEPSGTPVVVPPVQQAMPSWHDAEREERYAAFTAAHPEILPDDVYWMVGVDLDLAPYEQTRPVADPDDYLALVNKHFYLPSDYVPSDLISVGSTKMRKEAGDAMQRMIADAAAAGLTIWSQSGFRAYDLQVSLYNQYKASDGEAAADTYSARPGHSEHQTGLTTDLNTITDAFGDTAEGKWVAENCWKYGYIVRYTKENTGVTLYKPEPWHIRYVGEAAAKAMRDEGIASFEEYWAKHVGHEHAKSMKDCKTIASDERKADSG